MPTFIRGRFFNMYKDEIKALFYSNGYDLADYGLDIILSIVNNSEVSLNINNLDYALEIAISKEFENDLETFKYFIGIVKKLGNIDYPEVMKGTKNE
jgi:hypothetical protein